MRGRLTGCRKRHHWGGLWDTSLTGFPLFPSFFSFLPKDFTKGLFGERKNGHARRRASPARPAIARVHGVGDQASDHRWTQHATPRQRSDERPLVRCELDAWLVFGGGVRVAACTPCLEADGRAEDDAGSGRARRGRSLPHIWLRLRWSLRPTRACLYSWSRCVAYGTSGHLRPCVGMGWRVGTPSLPHSMYSKLNSNSYDRIRGPEHHHQTRHSNNEGREPQIRLRSFLRVPSYDVQARHETTNGC